MFEANNNIVSGSYVASSKQTFSASLAFGQEGEHIVAQMLLQQGYTVMPLYQFKECSTAPTVLSGSVSLVCPDLMVWKNGKAAYVEVKRKQQWVHWDGSTETGVNAAHYRDYKTLSDSTGVPLVLVFLHESQEPCGAFFTEIHNEETRSWDGRTRSGRYVGKPEVFFTSESLSRL